MGFKSVLSIAQQWVAERLSAGDTAVDATAGGGVDTLFLCRTVGSAGKVYAFDVQERALEQVRRRLEAQGSDGRHAAPSLLLRSHDELLEALPAGDIGRVGAVMFNLGYLPGAETAPEQQSAAMPLVITRPETTLPALEAALQALKPGGIATVVLYSGHEGGGTEAEAVQAWAEALPQERYQTVCYRFINAKAEAPYLIAVLKKPQTQSTPN
ncbi:class I SAM-dependent methyltransferase [Paenibacillus koleovorans]|uniref:class I SAM-dependent methyltransferase n=1 Tax=Paenibacillus koleovorans TaxID=121608 RepID=UPI000FD6DB49|nr:class I SAM-dependent methyltransferase [Paenibacillus koleovorans]